MKKLLTKFGEPKFSARFHKWAALFWFIAAFPIMYWFSTSIALLVFISVYAIVVGHWSGYQASAAEIEAGNSST